uniref:Uncharacterized protein n=1 Tax=Ananas comosus var. bracteatus TaxID=296719 RepID=A0A6V7PZY5_ANACO|nr:unnamed protein product [Ananas comosus var. bracteatus]
MVCCAGNNNISRSRESRRKGRGPFASGKTVGNSDPFTVVDDKEKLPWKQDTDFSRMNGWDTPKSQTSVTSPESSVTKPAHGYGAAPITPSPVSSAFSIPPDISESDDKVWHYKDPGGVVQGPFSISQLDKWSNYFPRDLRVWLTFEREENSLLLTDILRTFQKDSPRIAGNTGAKSESAWGGNDYRNTRQNNTMFSSTGYAGTNTGTLASRSDPKVEANYAQKGRFGASPRGWESSKDANSWHGQVQNYSGPALTAPVSARTDGPPVQHGRGLPVGDFSRWNNGQDSGSVWSPSKSEPLHPGNQSGESHNSNRSNSGQQFASQWPSDSYTVPSPTPQLSSRDWSGALSPSTASASGSMPISISGGKHQSTTAAIKPTLTASLADSAAAGSLNSANSVLKLSERAQGGGSCSESSGSVPSMTKTEQTAEAIQNQDKIGAFSDSHLSTKQEIPSEFGAKNKLINQSAVADPSGTQPEEVEMRQTWPEADDTKDIKSLVPDPTSVALSLELPDSPACVPCEADSVELHSRVTAEELGDRDSISIADYLDNSLLVHPEPNDVDPGSSTKPITETIVLELFTDQRSGTPNKQELASRKEEPDSSCNNPVSPGRESSFFRPEPILNWESLDDSTNTNWSLPSPTPASQPSGLNALDGSSAGHGTREKHVSSSSWKVTTQNPETVARVAQGNAESVNSSLSELRAPPKDTNPTIGWGASVQGNPNLTSSWITPGQENNPISGWGPMTLGNTSKNFNLEEPRNPAIANPTAGWGTALGNTNRSWSSPVGNADTYGNSYFDNRDLAHGGGKSSRSRSETGGGWGSSRPPSKGQAQRGVCKFYESGYCKKGPSCKFLHQ